MFFLRLHFPLINVLRTPSRVDYHLIVNDTLVSSPRQDPRVLYLANHKLTSNTQISGDRRRKDIHRLDTTNLKIRFEICVKFPKLSSHPVPSNTTVNFQSLPHPFIATNLYLFVGSLPSLPSQPQFYDIFEHPHIFKIYRPFLTFLSMKSSSKYYLLSFLSSLNISLSSSFLLTLRVK